MAEPTREEKTAALMASIADWRIDALKHYAHQIVEMMSKDELVKLTRAHASDGAKRAEDSHIDRAYSNLMSAVTGGKS